MIKMEIEDHNCATEVAGSRAEIAAEIVIAVNSLLEVFIRTLGVSKDVAMAMILSTIKSTDKAAKEEKKED